jgi:hypothetical protein
MNAVTWAQDLIVGIAAEVHPERVYAMGAVNYAFDVGRVLINTCKSFYDLKTSYKSPEANQQRLQDFKNEAIFREAAYYVKHKQNDKFIALAERESAKPQEVRGAGNALETAALLIGAEPIDVAISVLNMILDITSMVYTAVQTEYARIFREDLKDNLMHPTTHNLEYNAAKKRKVSDILNLIAMDLDNAIIDTMQMYVTLGVGTGGPAAIRLRNNGNIIIKAGAHKHLYAEVQHKASVPLTIAEEQVQWWINGTAALVKMGVDIGKLAQKGMDLTQAVPSSVEVL